MHVIRTQGGKVLIHAISRRMLLQALW